MDAFLKTRLSQRFQTILNLIEISKDQVKACNDGTGVAQIELVKSSKMLKFAVTALETDMFNLIERFPAEQTSPEIGNYLDAQLQAETILIEIEALVALGQQQDPVLESRKDTMTAKLPKLELEKFNGDVLKWHQFYDRFEANVHNKPIGDVTKLAYLLSLLEGEARQAVDGLSTTNENYTIAVGILKERYGSKKRVVDAHYEALNNLKRSGNSAGELRKTLDQVEKDLRVLQSMGENVNNNHLRVVLMNKFPEPIIYQVNLLCADKEDVGALRTALERVVSASEESASTAAQPSTSFSTEALHIQVKEKRPFKSYKRQSSGLGPIPPKKMRGLCVFCQGDHYSDNCRTVKTLMDRKKRLIGKCYRCLRSGHRMQQCTLRKPCFNCHGNHHRALCPSAKPNVTPKRDKTNPAVEAADAVKKNGNEFEATEEKIMKCQTNSNKSCLQTATAVICNDGKEVRCRLLLDSGSMRSYLTNKKARDLGLTLTGEDLLMIYTFGSNEPKETTSPSADIIIRTKRNQNKKITVNVVPFITGRIPVIKFEKELVDVFADDDVDGEGIDLLIGNDYYFSFMKREYLRIQDDLYLVNTDFGWIVSGRLEGSGDENVLSVITYNQSQEQGCPYFTEPDLPLRDTDMKFLWALESIGIVDSPKATREEEAVSYFNDTTLYQNGRYQVKWPWVQKPPELPTNYGLACGRLRSLLRRSDQETLDDYELILKEQLDANVIELVEPRSLPMHQTTPPIHYLPHHMVKQKGKRGRIVYDASAKIKDQKSLNECMYRGPSMLEDLLALLLKFRTGSIGILADVEKAFLQVGLHEDDRDVTRFLWVKDPLKELSEDNLIHFRFCRVPFGIIASPFLLTATIRHHIFKTDESLVKQIADRCYVDNLVTTADSTRQAEDLYQKTRKVFEELSMNIREWTSNDQELLEKIPEQFRSKETDKAKVLGLSWDLKDDTLELRLNESIFQEKTIEMTRDKRGILRTLASFYDPCGYAAPLVLPAKILLQELWKRKVKWDTPLSTETLEEWRTIVENLWAAREIKMPRYVGLSSDNSEIELHCFADASKAAYSAVVYLKVTQGQEIKVSFLMSKSRVTPLKEQDNLKIPRLELLACLIGSRVLKYVETALNVEIKRRYLWSDSLVVLSWMKSNKLLPPFVQRRVDEIRAQKNVEWRYVDTDSNPADLATRPELWHKKKQLWLNGPQFLLEAKELWPAVIEGHEISLCVAGVGLDDDLSDIPNEEICWQADQNEEVGSDVVQSAPADSMLVHEKLANIKQLQRQYFPDETSQKETHLTRNLGLYMDVDGVLRCRGRMANAAWTYDMKHPILIPKDCEFTNEVIRDVHEKNYHVGAAHTLSMIRQQYWIPQGRAQVQKILKKCTRCVKHSGGPYRLPPPPALPAERVNYSAAYTYTGVDYFGPVFVDSASGKVKRWVFLFTCLAVRAIHLEVVMDQSAQECLLAFRRFVSCRGLPSVVVSDNATQFKLTAEVLSDPFFTENSIKWRFIPQLAPWHGGFYERLIGLVKHCLKRTLEKHLLRDSQLITVLKEIEAVINSRPLTKVGSELEEVLRPSDFLTLGKCITAVPSDSETDKIMSVTKHDLIESWKRGRMIVDEMKRMFTNQYLPSLRERYRHSHKQPRITAQTSPQVGNIVQIQGDSKNRETWKVGRITSLIRGADGECRVAKVKVGNSELTRSIAHLYPLEVEMDDNIQSPMRHLRPELDRPEPTLGLSDLGTDLAQSGNGSIQVIQDDLNQYELAEKDPVQGCEMETYDQFNGDGRVTEVHSENEEIVINDPVKDGDRSSSVETPSAIVEIDVEPVGSPQEEAVEEVSEPEGTRLKRAAAIQARQKIAEWTRQLATLL